MTKMHSEFSDLLCPLGQAELVGRARWDGQLVDTWGPGEPLLGADC
jgi:hypothetical protein